MLSIASDKFEASKLIFNFDCSANCSEFDELMNLRLKSFWDFPSYAKFYQSKRYLFLLQVNRVIKKILSS